MDVNRQRECLVVGLWEGMDRNRSFTNIYIIAQSSHYGTGIGIPVPRVTGMGHILFNLNTIRNGRTKALMLNTHSLTFHTTQFTQEVPISFFKLQVL